MPYETDFQDAIVFSSEAGFCAPIWDSDPRLFLERVEIQNALHDVMLRLLGNPRRIENLSAKCVPVHVAVLEIVAAIVGTTPVLTFGCVTSEAGDKWFSVTKDEIRHWLSNGVENPHSLKLHAWLTLPSMEIIDFTLLPTHAHVQHMKAGTTGPVEFGVIAKHPDALTGMTYKPIVVGNDLAGKLRFPSIIIT